MAETQYRTCQQCNDEFKPTGNELFCCSECRYKFWKRSKKTNANDIGMTLDDIKCAVGGARMCARSIVASIARIELEYQDWEDRINAIENKIYELELQVGIEEKELGIMQKVSKPVQIDFDALEDVLNFKDLM